MNFTQAVLNWGSRWLLELETKLQTDFPTWAHRRDQILWVNVWLQWENVK